MIGLCHQHKTERISLGPVYVSIPPLALPAVNGRLKLPLLLEISQWLPLCL